MFAKLFGLDKKQKSASLAKERLQIIVAHQRNELQPKSARISSHLLAELKDEIIEVVKKYVALSEQNIRDIDLKVEDSSKNSTIEVNIPFN
ncbi:MULTISPECIES: cell division topological specificity factor MinE [Francisella]|uniref:Cell division topological specificity factor n=1 Tax=Francisella adeliensis TaxID=2007306 RepID=A0A2Z4Y021_9GAMM|nr:MULTISPECIES: cell division topological specificity factor MinE [Francisella]AXA34384.1 cell division topological specificity factor MinE [Francisella adeliensis]MBK2086475.1 cell division topological specificity factor MinE [Francisella adeliensis]MBK2096103.1 cell division topological specificity factor MinE [Francisella adeliensis]QIW12630.1 cell division topological specificity factor MinE [Francisella adeliensis]QIW14504.1 cell division topological specificity factor MinE [Francisella 